MDWQKRRCRRAEYQDIGVIGLDYTEDEVVFRVRGMGDEYVVVINQDANLFETVSCDCDDMVFRGSEIRCKHLCHVLLALGADPQDVCDPDYEPVQHELNELLMYAPLIVQDESRIPSHIDKSVENEYYTNYSKVNFEQNPSGSSDLR